MKRSLALLVLILFGGEASAQTACPQGVAPGSAQCGPSGGVAAPNTPAGPSFRWVLTWGAVAFDSTTGYATSTGKRSKHAAEREAMKGCKSRGGMGCKISMSYQNQCVAIAEPIEDLEKMISYVKSGLTAEEADRDAVASCSDANDGHACKAFYSNCTEPDLIRN